MKTKIIWLCVVFLMCQGVAFCIEEKSESFWSLVKQKRGAFVVKIVHAGVVSYRAVPIGSKRLRLSYVLGVGEKYDSLEKLANDFSRKTGNGAALYLGTKDFVHDNIDAYELGVFTKSEKEVLGLNKIVGEKQ